MDSSDDDEMNIPLAELCKPSTSSAPLVTTPIQTHEVKFDDNYFTDSNEYMSTGSEFSPDVCEVKRCKLEANSECDKCDMKLCVVHEENNSCTNHGKTVVKGTKHKKQTYLIDFNDDNEVISYILEGIDNKVNLLA